MKEVTNAVDPEMKIPHGNAIPEAAMVHDDDKVGGLPVIAHALTSEVPESPTNAVDPSTRIPEGYTNPEVGVPQVNCTDGGVPVNVQPVTVFP